MTMVSEAVDADGWRTPEDEQHGTRGVVAARAAALHDGRWRGFDSDVIASVITLATAYRRQAHTWW